MKNETITHVFFLVLTAISLWIALMVFYPGAYEASTRFIRDWGGFFGGFLGAMGAFGAALLTIERQKKERLRVLARELSEELDMVFDMLFQIKEKLWSRFSIEDSKNVFFMRKQINEVENKISKLTIQEQEKELSVIKNAILWIDGNEIFRRFRGRTATFDNDITSSANFVLRWIRHLTINANSEHTISIPFTIKELLWGLATADRLTTRLIGDLEKNFELRPQDDPDFPVHPD